MKWSRISTPENRRAAGPGAHWFRQPITRGHLVLCVVAMVAILLCHDIVQRLQQKWWLDSANIPWSAGDIAAMQHGSVADAAAIPELRGVPNVAVSYYDIDASDLKGIRWALWASALHGEGQLHNALSTWRYDWNWDPAPDGQCGVARARISFRAHVTLPRLTRPESLSPEVSQRWQAFMASLIRHEANHVHHAYDGRFKVAQAVRQSDCAHADQAGQWAINQLLWQEQAYDVRVRDGTEEGVLFPRGWGIPRGGWFGPADT